MTDAIAHRGPDDDGYFCSGPVGFGFRRLSIIDLEGGHQPMSDPARGIHLVFNGEIYNFAELRSELSSFGHSFQTRSDTEVILRGYSQWGIDVLTRLNGMFGLAIWDERDRRLLVARDRLGIKPIYFAIDNDKLLFGSEIRAILAHGDIKPEINPDAVRLFLRYRYTPSPMTIYKGIQKLAPGTRLVVENNQPRVERWWNFEPEPFDQMPSAREAEETVTELYRKAVRRQLISDVPVGLFLSGGLDSALLLALMTESGSQWSTYSVGFGRQFGTDELSQAAATAHHFHAQNCSIELSREDFEAGLKKAVAAVEEPVAADSIVPMYYLCQRARQDVKVALMGQGPDELFGGYRRHLVAKYGAFAAPFIKDSPTWMRSTLKALSGGDAVDRFLQAFDHTNIAEQCQAIFSQLSAELAGDLFQDNDGPGNSPNELLNCWRSLMPIMPGGDTLRALQFFEVRSALPDELLVYADKLSMAHGLEVRVPYLDHEIVEYVERLSSSYKVRNGSRKWLHRSICHKVLPAACLKRKKLGFETPSADWLRDRKDCLESEYLNDNGSLLYQFIRFDTVQNMLRHHRGGYHEYSTLLFSLTALEVWLRTARSNMLSPAMA